MGFARWSPIGLDAEGRWINAVQLGPRGRVVAASIPRDADGEAPTVDELTALARTLGRQGFHGRRVVVPVPHDRLVTDVSEVGDDGPDDEALRERAARASRGDGDGVEVAWWPLPARAGRGARPSVMSVACAHDDADEVIDRHEAAGLRVVALDARSCALARAAAVPGDEGFTALLHLGWTSAQVAVARGETVLFHRDLEECGLNRLYLTLSVRHGLDAEVAGVLLQDVGLDGGPAGDDTPGRRAADVHGQLRAHADRIIAEVRRSCSYVRQEYPDRPLGRLALGGEGADLPGMAASLAGAVAVEAAPITAGALAPAGAIVASLSTTARLATAIGLARHRGTVA